MQLVSARIWTHVAVSTSQHGNHYTTGTSCTLILSTTYALSFSTIANKSHNINTKHITIKKKTPQQAHYNLYLQNPPSITLISLNL